MLSDELLLLKIIEVGGSVDLLVKRGLKYSQIAIMIDNQIKAGTLEINSDSKICLTVFGKKLLKEQFNKMNYREKDRWIMPQEHYYHSSLPDEVIILPEKI